MRRELSSVRWCRRSECHSHAMNTWEEEVVVQLHPSAYKCRFHTEGLLQRKNPRTGRFRTEAVPMTLAWLRALGANRFRTEDAPLPGMLRDRCLEGDKMMIRLHTEIHLLVHSWSRALETSEPDRFRTENSQTLPAGLRRFRT